VLLMALGAAIVAIAQLAMTHAYRTLSVARGSSIQMLLPITTAIGGYLFFDERFSSIEILGATLTLLATWQVIRTPAERAALRKVDLRST
jgi:drug/metabolite transporter (DMT)-like permease